MNRWRNYGLWTSLMSLIGILINAKYPQYTGQYNGATTYILSILVGAGIISNPTTKRKWYDDDKE